MLKLISTPCFRQLFFFLLGPALCFSLYDLEPLEGMNRDGMRCLAACLWMMVWWMTEVLPIPVTSLIAIPVFGFLGIMQPEKVFALMGHPAMMLIFGATIIVGLWKESNLIERYAYWCFNLPFIKGDPVRMIFVFVFGAGILSAISPNIPLTVLFASVAVTIAKSCQYDKNNNMIRSFFTVSAIAPALGGVGTPLGGAPNILVIAMIATLLGHDVSFMEWSALGMPLVFIILFTLFLVTMFLFPIKQDACEFCLDGGFIKDKLESLGPVSLHEHIAIWIMIIALVLWSSGNKIFMALGMPEIAKMMNGPVIAAFLGIATFIIPFKKDNSTNKFVFSMNWQQAVRNIEWGVIVLQIGGIAFGQVLLQGGVDIWIVGIIKSVIGDISPVAIWFLLIVITGFFSQLILAFAVISLMLPITAAIAKLYGLDPLLVCLSVGFVSNLTTMFPFSSVPVAIVLSGSEGYANPRDFIKSGFCNTVVVTLIVFAFCYFLGPTILYSL